MLLRTSTTSTKRHCKNIQRNICNKEKVLEKKYSDILENIIKIYKDYHFDQHKGYGTKLHFEAIEEYFSIANSSFGFCTNKKLQISSLSK